MIGANGCSGSGNHRAARRDHSVSFIVGQQSALSITHLQV